jgi:hypothetical protein
MVDLKIVKQTQKHDPVTGIDVQCWFNGMKGTVLRCQSQQRMLNSVASAVTLAMDEGCFCPQKCALLLAVQRRAVTCSGIRCTLLHARFFCLGQCRLSVVHDAGKARVA